MCGVPWKFIFYEIVRNTDCSFLQQLSVFQFILHLEFLLCNALNASLFFPQFLFHTLQYIDNITNDIIQIKHFIFFFPPREEGGIMLLVNSPLAYKFYQAIHWWGKGLRRIFTWRGIVLSCCWIELKSLLCTIS
jgi:hypothetical protein